MALQLGALRNALIDAGEQPDIADKAAEEVAGYDNRISRVDVRLERLSGDVRVVQAMGAIMITLQLGMFWRMLSH